MLRFVLVSATCAWLLGCGSDSSGPSGSTSADGAAGSSSAADAASDTGDCDPRQTQGSGGSSSGSGGGGGIEAGVIVGDGGNIDLEGGSDPPFGYLKCYDPSTGAGFVCEESGQVCCEKKDNCWDPATDPTFCDRPWCPND